MTLDDIPLVLDNYKSVLLKDLFLNFRVSTYNKRRIVSIVAILYYSHELCSLVH